MSKKPPHDPCVIERWNETKVPPAKTPRDEQHLNELLMAVGTAMHRTVNETMSKLLGPHRDLVPLLHALRGAHMELATQLGLVEAWMAVLMTEEGVPLEYIERERDKAISDGVEHANQHLVGGCEKCTN